MKMDTLLILDLPCSVRFRRFQDDDTVILLSSSFRYFGILGSSPEKDRQTGFVDRELRGDPIGAGTSVPCDGK